MRASSGAEGGGGEGRGRGFVLRSSLQYVVSTLSTQGKSHRLSNHSICLASDFQSTASFLLHVLLFYCLAKLYCTRHRVMHTQNPKMDTLDGITPAD